MQTRGSGVGVLAGVLAWLGGCGGVAVREPERYRIAVPPVPVAGVTGLGALRVADVEVVAELAGDHMQVADGPVRVMAYRGHRFAGSLDRLCADALVTGLRRSGAFAQVHSALAPGTADVELRARVLDFHQAPVDGGWGGLVTLDVQVFDLERRLLLATELTAATPLADPSPAALAVALSRSLEQVLVDLVRRCAELDALAAPR
jgi:ABC-type uncharacterized transport system auxiliary subunit